MATACSSTRTALCTLGNSSRWAAVQLAGRQQALLQHGLGCASATHADCKLMKVLCVAEHCIYSLGPRLCACSCCCLCPHAVQLTRPCPLKPCLKVGATQISTLVLQGLKNGAGVQDCADGALYQGGWADNLQASIPAYRISTCSTQLSCTLH